MGAYLSSPKTNKESFDGGDLKADPSRYGLSCMQGWRKSMEDSHICYHNIKLKQIEEEISIYGVFDGHGGPNVSKWISFNFRRIFLKCIKEADEELITENLHLSKNYKLKLIKLALEKTFLKMDEEILLIENQEKLKKYSVQSQENEEESDTRENYIYSILNDIVSKNISIKSIERDGKRCLQVAYNKSGNPLEEDGNPDAPGLSFTQENNTSEEDNKSLELFNGVEKILEDENDDVLESAEERKGNKTNEDDDLIKKDDANSNSINATDNEVIITEQNKEQKDDITKNKDTKTEGNYPEKDSDKLEIKNENEENKNTELKLRNKVKIEVKENKIEFSDLNVEGKNISLQQGVNEENKNKISNGNKESSAHLDNEEINEINTKRLKKNINNEKDYKETGTSKHTENDKVETIKSELTYENLKQMEQSSKIKNDLFEKCNNNNNNQNNNNDNNNDGDHSINRNISYEENSTKLYDKSNNEEEIPYDEAITHVIDNNISNVNDNNNNNNNDVDDSNGAYSSDELRLFENSYANDYEDNIAYNCGSTALVAVILKGYLIIANAGDSRAIICFNGNSLSMSTDHKPHLQSEEDRIKKAGGYIANGRVDGNLNLTRAIGDLHYKRDPFLPQKDQKISAFPEITCVTLIPEDEFLFLACDGIWDCKEGQDIVYFVNTRLENFDEIPNDTSIATEGNKENTNYNFDDDEEIKDAENVNKEDVSSNKNQLHVVEAGVSNIHDDHDSDNDNNHSDENKNEVSQDEHNNENNDLEIKKDSELDKNEIEDKQNSELVIQRKKYERFNKLSQICEELCDECLSNNYKESDGIGCDNMTCLLVQYNPIYKTQTEKKFLNIDKIE